MQFRGHFLVQGREARAGEDLIFTLNAEASARKAAGESILNATVGVLLDDEGKLAVIETVHEVLRELPAAVGAAYPPIAGPPDFLSAVIKDLFGSGERAREGLREAAGWAVAVATPGGCGALRHSIANFLEPQQTLLTTSFYWGPYRTLADELDRSLVTFRMLNELGRFDAVDLERKLGAVMEAQGRALLFLNTPCHNPTGYSLDAEDFDGLVNVIERAAARGPLAVVLDVAYARFGREDVGASIEPLLRLAGKALLLFAWSASKSFTQYGLRVGALVAVHPDPQVRRSIEGALTFSSRGTWACCNAAGMAAIARVLTTPELRARADDERAALLRLLGRREATWNEHASRSGLRFPRYSGGFFTTVLCEGAATVAAHLKADGIFVVPLTGGIRVALCGVSDRDIPRLVEGLARRIGG